MDQEPPRDANAGETASNVRRPRYKPDNRFHSRGLTPLAQRFYPEILYRKGRS